MKKKIIAWVLTISSLLGLQPAYAGTVIQKDIRVYDYNDFENAGEVKWIAAKGLESGYSPDVTVEKDSDGGSFLNMSPSQSLSSDVLKTPYIIRMTDGIEYKEDKKIVIDVKLRTYTKTTNLDSGGRGPRLQMKYNLEESAADSKKLKYYDPDKETNVSYSIGSNHLNLWEIINGNVQVFNGKHSGTNWAQTLRNSSFKVPYEEGDWVEVRTVLDGKAGTADFYVENKTQNISGSVTGQKLHFTNGDALKSIAFANFYMHKDDTYVLSDNLKDTNIEYLKVYEADSVDSNGEMSGEVKLHINDEFNVKSEDFAVCEGFESKIKLSEEKEDGVTFLRMNTLSSGTGVSECPYIRMPINGGDGITYKEGKQIAVEVKFRTDTVTGEGLPDARMQFKYNLPDNLTELKNMSFTDADGITRKYTTGFNDCAMWEAISGGFRGPKSYVETGSSRQTNMHSLNIPFKANTWYVVKTYIDGINETFDYEVTDLKTGKKYEATGFKPYFPLGDKLLSIAFHNFKEPVNNTDIDYIKVYECEKTENSNLNLKFDFEGVEKNGLNITNENGFKFIAGDYSNGRFAVSTINGAYSVPVTVAAEKDYLLSLCWKAQGDETLSITADGTDLSGSTEKVGEWNVTKALYSGVADKTVNFSSKLSSGSEYFIDDWAVEEIVLDSMEIDIPDKLFKGSNQKVNITFKSLSGEIVPGWKEDIRLTLSGTEKSKISEEVLSVAEDENVGKISVKATCDLLGLTAEKTINIFDEIESTVSYEDADGNPLPYGISDNGVYCDVKLKNNGEASRFVNVAAAVYTGGKLLKVAGFKSDEISSGETKTLSFGPYEGFGRDDQLKIFVWKDMTPTAKTEIAEYSDVSDTFYVAPNGDDSATGTIDNPLKTLEGARDKIRAMGVIPEGGITVYIRGGIYKRDKEFTLNASDSGQPGSSIKYVAYPGEKPVFTQGIEIDLADSEKVEDAGILAKLPDDNARAHLYAVNLKNYGITELVPADHIGAYSSSLNKWVNTLKDTEGAATFEASPTTPTNEVFFDGKPMTVARYPNGDNWINVTNPDDLINVGAIPRFWEENMVGNKNYIEEENRDINDFFTIRLSDRVDRWTEAKDALMFGFWYNNWATQTVGIGAIDTENNTITSDRPSYFGVIATTDDFAKYYVYNLIEELDKEGEYYFDRENLKLYFYRSDDMTAGKKLSVSNGRFAFINVNNASNVVIEGLEFNVGRYVGINVVGNDVTVKDCIVKNLPDRAILTSGNNNLVTGCEVSDVNGGITVTSNGSYKNGFQYGNSVIEKCNIKNFSRRSLVYTTAITLNGVGNRAVNNEMSDSYHMAVSVSGNDNLLMGNEIYDVCRYANDAAAVYMGRSWVNRGNKVIGNYIHDIHPDPVWAKTIGVNAVFADDLYGNLTVSGNIFEDIDGYAVKFNGGYDNVVTNNTFINCTGRANLTGGTVGIGRYSADATTTDDYILAVSCVDQLKGLVSSGYLNSCWEEDSHSVEEIKNLPLGDDPEGYKGVEVSPIENFVLFMKSDEWKENEEENIIKYINKEWHKKYPEIYEYIVNHGGDTYGNVYKDNILINSDGPKTSNMTNERFAASGNTVYEESVLLSGDYRAVDYSGVTDKQKSVQVSSQFMGIDGVTVNEENPTGVIVDDDCVTAEGFRNYNQELSTITNHEEDGVSFVRMTGTKTAKSNNITSGMLYDIYDKDITFKDGEKIVIDTRLRHKVTSENNKDVPYALVMMNMPMYAPYADLYKVLSQKSTDGKNPDTDENGDVIMQKRAFSVQSYDTALVGFLDGSYAYGNGYGNGSNAKCVGMKWTKEETGLGSLNQFTDWIRVVVTVDKCAGEANYKFYRQDGTLMKETSGTLANASTDMYFNNIGFGPINAARGDMTIDVDYVKISIEK